MVDDGGSATKMRNWLAELGIKLGVEASPSAMNLEVLQLLAAASLAAAAPLRVYPDDASSAARARAHQYLARSTKAARMASPPRRTSGISKTELQARAA
jgi:hypothetical protein